MGKKYLTEQQVADMTGLSLSTLRSDRSDPDKRKIPYVKIGRNVRYDYDDVVNSMDQRKIAAG